MPARKLASDLADRIDIDELPASALLTRAQVSNLSGFALSTLKMWAAEDRGPKITRIEGVPRFRVADVRAWMGGEA